MHAGRHPGGRRIGPYVEPLSIQKAERSRGALDSAHHRGEKVSIESGLIHETRHVGFRHYDHVDFGYRTWMMERQDEIILVDAIHVELT